MSDSQAKKSLHPLIAIAAVSVIVLSMVGVAAMTGLLPGSKGEVKPDLTNANLSAIAPDNKEASTPVVAKAEAQTTPSKNVASKTATNHTASAKHVDNSVSEKRSEKRHDVIASEKSVQAICDQCGVIESVRSIEQKAEKGSGVGAVAGAVLGGVLGHQVGGGNGRKLATVAGAVGGGYAGNEIEKSRNTHTVYEVNVKMENGELRTFKLEHKPDWRSGDRVKLVDGRLISNE